MTETIKLLIVDDHKVVREGLKAFIAPTKGLEVLGEASNGSEAIKMAKELKPDVILLDLVMPEMDGIETTHMIKKANLDCKVLIITSFLEEEQVIRAIKAGAAGYMMKDSSPEEIEQAITDVHQGNSAFPSRIASILVKALNQSTHPKEDQLSLTDRETEVLKLLAQGLSNQEIADQLFLSVWTVRTYVTSILDKLNLENRTQAALFALKQGLVSLED